MKTLFLVRLLLDACRSYRRRSEHSNGGVRLKNAIGAYLYIITLKHGPDNFSMRFFHGASISQKLLLSSWNIY